MRGFAGWCQDLVGKFMNALETVHFKKVETEVTPFVEGSLSWGIYSISGTVEYNCKDKTLTVTGSESREVCYALTSIVNMGVFVDNEYNYGLEGEVSIPFKVVDVKINGGYQRNNDGSFEITLKAGVGKELLITEGSAYVGGKLKLSSNPWEYDTQNGSHGTAENGKNNSLNKNLSIYQDSMSADCFWRYFGDEQ